MKRIGGKNSSIPQRLFILLRVRNVSRPYFYVSRLAAITIRSSAGRRYAQCATINWDFKSHQDNVKVELWDVVDVAVKQPKHRNTRTGSSNSSDTAAGGGGSGGGSSSVSAAGMGRNCVELLDATVRDIA